MNKELLLKVADAIEANPEHFDIENWFNMCGTTACIVGWAWHIYLGNKNLIATHREWQGMKRYEERTEDLLGISNIDHIAFTQYWLNKRLADRFEKAKRSGTRAKIAAAYVRWFVENI
jgi:hypothetical protein